MYSLIFCADKFGELAKVGSGLQLAAGQNGRVRRFGLLGLGPEAERLSMVGASRRVSGSEPRGDLDRRVSARQFRVLALSLQFR